MVIIFRALGYVADRDIIEHVVYDLTDGEMMDLFRPSLEEAFVIQRQEIALDFIGRRGSARDVTKDDRIRYFKSEKYIRVELDVNMHVIFHYVEFDSELANQTDDLGFMLEDDHLCELDSEQVKNLEFLYISM